ncbi:MAG: ComF family protein [Proteobacteria bacterium]|nr:ComF family protein [Pseudomonadota bacterium]
MLSSLLNILLPTNCPLCLGTKNTTRSKRAASDKETGGLCAACRYGLKKITSPICTHCGAPFISEAGADHLCAGCIKTKKIPFIKARSALYYTQSATEGISLFKYHSLFALKPAFEAMLAPVLKEFIDMDLIVPVPLHRRRLRHRGFNQSLILARLAAKRLNAELDYTSFKRTKLTKPQTELKGKDRRQNVRGAFEVKREAAFKAKKVLLVDDVYTTGATVTECARVLKKAGAEVSVLTLARTARV